MILILGGHGFVGQAYARLFDKKDIPYQVADRKNYQDLTGRSYDVLINANGNSKKFMSDRDPVWDFEASVTSVVRSLNDFKAGKYVFLSSGDVYPRQDNPEITREDDAISIRESSRYGLHKYIAETMVRSTHAESLIVRMGGFVGPGMKKNAIFDMLNDQPIWLHPDSQLQFISTDKAAEIVWGLISGQITNETVNLGARSTVRIGDIYDRIRPRSGFRDEARRVQFEISTAKLEALSEVGIPTSAEEIDYFLRSIGR